MLKLHDALLEKPLASACQNNRLANSFGQCFVILNFSQPMLLPLNESNRRLYSHCITNMAANQNVTCLSADEIRDGRTEAFRYKCQVNPLQAVARFTKR